MTTRQKASAKLTAIAVFIVAVIVGHFVQRAHEENSAQQGVVVAVSHASDITVEPLVQRQYIPEDHDAGPTTVVKDVGYAILTNRTSTAFCRVTVRMDYVANGQRSVDTSPVQYEDIDHLFVGPGETQRTILGGYDPSSHFTIVGLSVVSAMPCSSTASQTTIH